MRLIKTVREMNALVDGLKKEGKTIALVPTMGSLHEGHLSLVETAKRQADAVVMSIFVNPLQFGAGEDFSVYPRDLIKDCSLAEIAGVDCVFAPSADEMYLEGFASFVEVAALSEHLCGAARPGHFRGVTTVITKLFNIVMPDLAVFGQKDAQQVTIIERLTADLNLRTKIVRSPILREEDGLAMSSRNSYLSPEERSQAVVISRSMSLAEELFGRGELDAEAVKTAVRAKISETALAEIEYVEIVDKKSLVPVTRLIAPALLACAVRFGKTRLIDNIVLE